jgi:hypothetical protein
MTPRMMIRRIPSSIKEKDQSSIEPKAIGVNIERKMRMNLIIWLSIVVKSMSPNVY